MCTCTMQTNSHYSQLVPYLHLHLYHQCLYLSLQVDHPVAQWAVRLHNRPSGQLTALGRLCNCPRPIEQLQEIYKHPCAASQSRVFSLYLARNIFVQSQEYLVSKCESLESQSFAQSLLVAYTDLTSYSSLYYFCFNFRINPERYRRLIIIWKQKVPYNYSE